MARKYTVEILVTMEYDVYVMKNVLPRRKAGIINEQEHFKKVITYIRENELPLDEISKATGVPIEKLKDENVVLTH